MAKPTLKDVMDAIAALRAEMVTKADLAALLEGEFVDEDAVDPVPEPDPFDDVTYGDAVRVVADTRRCSTSWLQRKLSIGYNRSERIVAELERRGVVGPRNTNGEHSVLIGQ